MQYLSADPQATPYTPSVFLEHFHDCCDRIIAGAINVN
jgi:hypothetical protein